jgi:FkbM family methyltransferase
MENSPYAFLKKVIKTTLASFGVAVLRHNVHTSKDVLMSTILKEFQIDTVIDVGANEGQYAKTLLDHGYKGKVYSFEPIKSVFEKLKKTASNFSQWTTFNVGMGSKEEDILMNIAENLVSSSILKVGQATLAAEPKTRITHQEVIKITTLDLYCDKTLNLSKNTLLKLDVQGYELEALKGAKKMISSMRLIQAELSFIPVYEGAPLFQEVVGFLNLNGFEIYSIIPEFIDPKTGRLLQADGIFVNKSIS